jgi:hypothetical protein
MLPAEKNPGHGRGKIAKSQNLTGERRECQKAANFLTSCKKLVLFTTL